MGPAPQRAVGSPGPHRALTRAGAPDQWRPNPLPGRLSQSDDAGSDDMDEVRETGILTALVVRSFQSDIRVA